MPRNGWRLCCITFKTSFEGSSNTISDNNHRSYRLKKKKHLFLLPGISWDYADKIGMFRVFRPSAIHLHEKSIPQERLKAACLRSTRVGSGAQLAPFSTYPYMTALYILNFLCFLLAFHFHVAVLSGRYMLCTCVLYFLPPLIAKWVL